MHMTGGVTVKAVGEVKATFHVPSAEPCSTGVAASSASVPLPAMPAFVATDASPPRNA